MGKGKNDFFASVSKAVSVQQIRNKKPLVEILGHNRILIENHIRVLDYQPQQILIKVSFGQISICGSGLTLMYMSCEQLVISGIIDSVSLYRRTGE